MRHDRAFKLCHSITQIQKIDEGGVFKVTIKVPFHLGWMDQVNFHVYSDDYIHEFQMGHVKNENEEAYFEVAVELEKRAIYHYYFSFHVNGQIRYYQGAKNKFSVGFEVPNWAKGSIMYHIFVDRYRKGPGVLMRFMPRRTIHDNWNKQPVIGPDQNGEWNIDFFGGNLNGITETLKYIKSLGVTVIYLSPIFRSQSNHRYDTSDYEQIDPYAGVHDDLRRLCEKAHQMGMKVILDAVFNHTGNDSKYFNEFGTFETLGAYQSNESPYYTFYKKHRDSTGRHFSYWWGMKNLPECNGNSAEWKEYIYGVNGVIDKWFDLGIDGLRLDVADELTDEFIEGIANAVKRNKSDGFVLGEVWKNPMRMGRNYISSGRGMHSIMNYLLVDSLIRYYKHGDVYKLNQTIEEIQAEYPEGTIQTLMNFTSTHDISRAIEIFGCHKFKRYGEWAWNLLDDRIESIKAHKMTREEYKDGKKMFKSYVSVLAFLPGILSIFYGDEVGVQGIGNLANRATYPWGRRDKDLLYFFRKIGKVRNAHEFLKEADLRIVDINHEQIIFERFDENNAVLLVASKVNYPTHVEIPEEYYDSEVIFKNDCSDIHTLAPYGAIVLKLKKV